MRTFLSITKALSDETRVRALLALREGELCLCQIIDLLELAPPTVSKHMALLHEAGLVRRRKQGRWHYVRLSGKEAPVMVRQAVRWALDSLQHEPQAVGDVKKLCGTRRKDLSKLSACYSR